jgi:SIR2-like domain
MEPTRIAQHYADKHARDALYLLVNQKLGTMRPSPTIVHRFIATFRGRLQARGLGAPSQLIFTTNYDDWMEYTLNTVGVRYHLFTYRVNDPHASHFIYQSPSGGMHLIDRPSHFRRLSEDGTVVVKLHGGLHRSIDLPISYALMHRDFVELAGRLHSTLPQVILDLLQGRSLLFLGSGLGDDSIESLVRAVQSADLKKLSWAVQWRSSPERQLYWRALGVEIINIRLEQFMLGLNKAFNALAGSKSATA